MASEKNALSDAEVALKQAEEKERHCSARRGSAGGIEGDGRPAGGY